MKIFFTKEPTLDKQAHGSSTSMRTRHGEMSITTPPTRKQDVTKMT